MYTVLVIGELCEDILMHNPSSVAVMGHKVWAEDITATAGGSASYASAVLAHMGAVVRLFSVVGDDAAGATILELLRRRRIDCAQVKALPNQKTTKSIVVCDRSSKTFIGCSPMLPMQLPSVSDLDGCDMVYIAGYMLYPELWTDEMFTFLQETKRRGILLALDGQLLPVPELDAMKLGRMARLFPLVDLFFIAGKEVAQLLPNMDADAAGKTLLDMGCTTVVLKQGADGCIVMTRSCRHRESVFQSQVYDSVGSGDIFGASFCFGWLSGWDIPYCCGYANVFTALSLGQYENYRIYPDVDTVHTILATECEKERIQQ